MTMNDDGTGTITVVATADADVVQAVPTIADELALDDVVAAGWIVDGPTATPDGGLTISISHPFTSAADATNLLNSIGPPFNQMAVERTTVNNDTTNSMSGLLGLTNGFESFADEDLVHRRRLDAVRRRDRGERSDAGDVAVRHAAGGASGRDRHRRTRTARCSTTTRSSGPFPTDGSIIELRAQSVQAPENNAWWARPLSIGALVLLIGWVAFMTLFIGYVAYARSRRSRRYRKRPRPTPSSSV